MRRKRKLSALLFFTLVVALWARSQEQIIQWTLSDVMLLVSQCNGFQVDRHKIIPHQTIIKMWHADFNRLWHTCHQVWSKRGRYGESGRKEGNSCRQNPLPVHPVHSSQQWTLLSSAPCHSVILFRILQATFLKGRYWQRCPVVKPAIKKLWNKWVSSKIRSWAGWEDAADETCCAEDKTWRAGK